MPTSSRIHELKNSIRQNLNEQIALIDQLCGLSNRDQQLPIVIAEFCDQNGTIHVQYIAENVWEESLGLFRKDWKLSKVTRVKVDLVPYVEDMGQ